MASRGKGRSAPQVFEGSFYDLCRRFIESEIFRGYTAGTQSLWERELKFACAPNCLGHIPLTEIRPALIQGYLDGWSDKPGKQQNALRAIKALEKWAVVRDLVPRSITLGVATGRPVGGHIPWTDAQVTVGEQVARSDLARVITLGSHTGQRISDLVRMAWTDIRVIRGQPGIDVRQKKIHKGARERTWVVIDDELAKKMATWERQPGPILRRLDGSPWESKNLTLAWRHELNRNPDLAEHKELRLVLHGLRGHCCTRLARAGLNDRQIANIVGMSVENVENYTKLSAQEENAMAAVIQLKDRYPQDKPLKQNDA
jgi:integrase